VHDVEWNLVSLDILSGLNIGGSIARALYSPLDTIPTLMTKHFLFPPEAHSKLRFWERRLTLQFPTIVCVDRSIERTVLRWAAEEGVVRDVRFIPNSVDTEHFKAAPMPPIERLRVGFVARLDAVRGEAFLEDFLRNLPDFVEFFGAIAASRERFDQFAARFASERIHLMRNVPQASLPEFLRGVHILFNPLLVDYPVTRSALEAMACGRAVLMFGEGDRPPLIDGETAVFCAPDLSETVSRLEDLWQSPDRLAAMGRQARRVVEKEFSHAHVLPALEREYIRILGDRHG
jgi:glycosyltransferase involved in cell wall biosynthesis